jgi:hypothetical protein
MTYRDEDIDPGIREMLRAHFAFKMDEIRAKADAFSRTTQRHRLLAQWYSDDSAHWARVSRLLLNGLRK